MTSTEQNIFNIIRRRKNARVQYIAKTAGMSSGYINLVCQGLARRGHINFVRGLAQLAVADEPDRDETMGQATGDIPEESTSDETQTQEPAQEDVKPEEEERPVTEEEEPKVTPIVIFKGLKKDLLMRLQDAGYDSEQDVARAPLPKLMQCGMNVKQAADLINKARATTGMINED